MPRPRHDRALSIAGTHWRRDGAPKARYRSQGEAAAIAEERGREHGVKLGVYRCDFCRGWHLGRPADGPNATGRRGR